MTELKVEGSRRKEVNSSGSLRRASWMVWMMMGKGERRLMAWHRVRARVGASAGQAPERRCTRSPLGEVQEGRRQAPVSPGPQWRRSQSVL